MVHAVEERVEVGDGGHQAVGASTAPLLSLSLFGLEARGGARAGGRAWPIPRARSRPRGRGARGGAPGSVALAPAPRGGAGAGTRGGGAKRRMPWRRDLVGGAARRGAARRVGAEIFAGAVP